MDQVVDHDKYHRVNSFCACALCSSLEILLLSILRNRTYLVNILAQETLSNIDPLRYLDGGYVIICNGMARLPSRLTATTYNFYGDKSVFAGLGSFW
jgi:hypothetical protein